MIEKETVFLRTGPENEIELPVSLSGFIEKIDLVYSTDKEHHNNPISILKFYSSEGELILGVTGEKNAAYYPRAVAHGPGGNPLYYDGINPVTTRFFVSDHVLIKFVSDAPSREVKEINIFYENNHL